QFKRTSKYMTTRTTKTTRLMRATHTASRDSIGQAYGDVAPLPSDVEGVAGVGSPRKPRKVVAASKPVAMEKPTLRRSTRIESKRPMAARASAQSLNRRSSAERIG